MADGPANPMDIQDFFTQPYGSLSKHVTLLEFDCALNDLTNKDLIACLVAAGPDTCSRTQALVAIQQLDTLTERSYEFLQKAVEQIGPFAKKYFPERWFSKASITPFYRGSQSVDKDAWPGNETCEEGGYLPFLDSSFGFYLVYRDKPIAVATCAVPAANFFCNVQVQGVSFFSFNGDQERSHHPQGLPGNNERGSVNDIWAELMHRVSQLYAEHLGFSNFGIIHSGSLPFQDYELPEARDMSHLYDDVATYLDLKVPLCLHGHNYHTNAD